MSVAVPVPRLPALTSRAPTPEQQAALAALEALAATRRFHAALLHGVTGSIVHACRQAYGPFFD